MKPLSLIAVLLLASVAQAQPAPPGDPNQGDPNVVATLHSLLVADYKRVTDTYTPDTAIGQMETAYRRFLLYADQLVDALVGVNVVPNDVAFAYSRMTTGRAFAKAWFDMWESRHSIVSERHDVAHAKIFTYAISGTLEAQAEAIIAVEDHRTACTSLIDHANNLPAPQELTALLDALTIVSNWAANR